KTAAIKPRRSFHSLLSLRLGSDDVYAPALPVERDHAIGESKQRVVLAAADVKTRVVLGAALADDDAAGADGLAAVDLHAQPLAVRLAAIADGTLTFLMRHDYLGAGLPSWAAAFFGSA